MYKKKGSDSLVKEKRVDLQRHRGVGDARVSNEEDFKGLKSNDLFGGGV